MQRVHELKTEAILWDAVARGDKLFEVRRNDRFFQAGEVVVLLRLCENPGVMGRVFTGADGGTVSSPIEAKRLVFRIGPILQGGQFGIEPGYCIFSLLPLATDEKAGGRDAG